MTGQLLTAKELAFELRRSYRYVRYMRKAGFQMPGGVATIAEARQWLERNHPPCPPPRRKSHSLPLAAH